MKLSDREWGEFKLDKICLYIKSGVSINENSRKNGLVPYVSATSLNNGISDFIKNINCGIDSNVISVNVNGSIGYSFFHKYNALFSSDCKKIKIKKYSDNEYVSLFVCNQIMQQKNKYCYGYKMGKRLAKQIILLPITPQGEPDYEFMEEYIKEIINKKRQKYTEYVKDKMKSLKVVGGGQSLKNRKWKNFKIKELFNIYTGKDLIINKIKNGNIPVVSHSLENNGIVAYTALICDRKKFNFKKTISLADRGNFKAFVQKNDFYIGTRVKALELKLDNVPYFSLIFISNEINKQSCKFSYGHNACDNIKDLQIILPATQQNQPDYEFMENYIKNKMFLKYNKYLQYIKNQ